jgi:hypothetical protein
MSEDLNKKLKQITDMLSQEDLPDNIKGLLSLLASAGSNEDSSPKASVARPVKEDRREKSEPEDGNIDMMRKVKKVMDRVNNVNDPKISLLFALKPFLNTRRQKKLNNCINLLRMSSLARLMEDHDKGDF